MGVVQREHETVDLWTALAEDRELIAGEAVDADRPFTAGEKKQVAERLLLLKQQIVLIAKPDPVQDARLDRAIVALNAAAESMNRGQWKLLFVGAMMQALFELGLDPDPQLPGPDLIVQIWPIGNSVHWPPVRSLTDAEFPLLLRRFKYSRSTP